MADANRAGMFLMGVVERTPCQIMIPEGTIHLVIPKSPYCFIDGIMVLSDDLLEAKLPKLFDISQEDEGIVMFMVIPEGSQDYFFVGAGVIGTSSTPEVDRSGWRTSSLS